MICDICGKALGSASIAIIPPAVVVAATHSGFLPSRLPPTWKKQLEQQLGIELGGPGVPAYHVAFDLHWRKVVDDNASEDWGLCKDCNKELDLYVTKLKKSTQKSATESSSVSCKSKNDQKVNELTSQCSAQPSQQKKTDYLVVPFKKINKQISREKSKQSPSNQNGKLSLFAWLFGLDKKKVWYLLPKEKKATGPYSAKELKEEVLETTLKVGLKIRKGKKGPWISWVNAVETYSILACTSSEISNKKQKQLSSNKKQMQLSETQDIFRAAEDGDLGQVESLLASGINPNATDKRGNSALHIAAEKGFEEIVASLIAAGAKRHSANDKGETAMVLASGFIKTPAIVQRLLRSKQGANSEDRPTKKQLSAALCGMVKSLDRVDETVKLLLDLGADPTEALIAMVSWDTFHDSVMDLLIESGAELDGERHGKTPLFAAASAGRRYAVIRLIESGATREGYQKDKSPNANRLGMIPGMGGARFIKDPNEFGGENHMADSHIKVAIESYNNAKRWFAGDSYRRPPASRDTFTSSDFDPILFGSWRQVVCLNPQRSPVVTAMRIDDLGTVAARLYEAFKHLYQLTSAQAVEIFDRYLGAACPKCWGGITGELLGSLGVWQNNPNILISPEDTAVQRLLDGLCPHCDSRYYYVLWFGEEAAVGAGGGAD
jgi:hypothetical protein